MAWRLVIGANIHIAQGFMFRMPNVATFGHNRIIGDIIFSQLQLEAAEVSSDR